MASNTFFIEDQADLDFIMSMQEAESNSDKANVQPNIDAAKELVDDYDYDKGLEICMALLKQDYSNIEAHMLV